MEAILIPKELYNPCGVSERTHDTLMFLEIGNDNIWETVHNGDGLPDDLVEGNLISGNDGLLYYVVTKLVFTRKYKGAASFCSIVYLVRYANCERVTDRRQA